MEIEAFGLSDRGLVRPNNEDALELLHSHRFYALADGLGGRNSGEIASKETLLSLCHSIQHDPILKECAKHSKKVPTQLFKVIQETNSKIWSMGQKDVTLTGMGTTLSCILFCEQSCFVANVGDSRVYRLRNGKLELLTHDDSLVFDLLQFGLIDEDEAKSFPLKHVITKSIGGVNQVEPTITESNVLTEDLFLLCSDGLYNLVEEKKIEEILTHTSTIKEATHKLIETALIFGGLDNVSVILLKIA